MFLLLAAGILANKEAETPRKGDYKLSRIPIDVLCGAAARSIVDILPLANYFESAITHLDS